MCDAKNISERSYVWCQLTRSKITLIPSSRPPNTLQNRNDIRHYVDNQRIFTRILGLKSQEKIRITNLGRKSNILIKEERERKRILNKLLVSALCLFKGSRVSGATDHLHRILRDFNLQTHNALSYQPCVVYGLKSIEKDRIYTAYNSILIRFQSRTNYSTITTLCYKRNRWQQKHRHTHTCIFRICTNTVFYCQHQPYSVYSGFSSEWQLALEFKYV